MASPYFLVVVRLLYAPLGSTPAHPGCGGAGEHPTLKLCEGVGSLYRSILEIFSSKFLRHKDMLDISAGGGSRSSGRDMLRFWQNWANESKE